MYKSAFDQLHTVLFNFHEYGIDDDGVDLETSADLATAKLLYDDLWSMYHYLADEFHNCSDASYEVVVRDTYDNIFHVIGTIDSDTFVSQLSTVLSRIL